MEGSGGQAARPGSQLPTGHHRACRDRGVDLARPRRRGRCRCRIARSSLLRCVMAVSDHVDLPTFLAGVRKRNPGQPEFVQAVQEVAEDVFDYIADKAVYHEYQILRRIAEPDRVVSFRVCWEDDRGNIRLQRGWRVQNNNAIGPYKGGIRFHASVTESVLKFLAFEDR